MIKNSAKKGVNLIEVMIAFLILVVAIFGAIGAIEYGHKATRSDFRQGEAIQILSDRMNKLSALPFSRLKSFIVSAGGNNAAITNEVADIAFGETTIGKNKYNVHAVLEYQPIKFRGLMQLHFPNKEYDPAQPYTWQLERRGATGEEIFDGGEDRKPYVCIKVTVYVKPVEFYMTKERNKERNEREVFAVTYVTDLEA